MEVEAKAVEVQQGRAVGVPPAVHQDLARSIKSRKTSQACLFHTRRRRWFWYIQRELAYEVEGEGITSLRFWVHGSTHPRRPG